MKKAFVNLKVYKCSDWYNAMSYFIFFLIFMAEGLGFLGFLPCVFSITFLEIKSSMNTFRSTSSVLFFPRDCVQCRAFDKGEKKETCSQECMHFNMTRVESRDKLPQPGQPDPLSHCKEKDVDDCWFYFTYSVNSNGEANVHVVETPGRNMMLPVPPLLLICAVFGCLWLVWVS